MAIENDAPLGGCNQPGYRSADCRLTAAALADETKRFTLRNCERNTVNGMSMATDATEDAAPDLESLLKINDLQYGSGS